MARTRAQSQPAPPTDQANSRVSSLDIFDCQSLFDFVGHLRQYAASTAEAGQSVPPPNFDYRACREVLQESRARLGWQPAQHGLAIVTVDPDSEGQDRFVTALERLQILVEPVDFRDAKVTLPLSKDSEGVDRSSSLAPNIAYVLGLLAERPSPEVVVVTRAFELFPSMRDFAEQRNGRAAIAFFRRFLDFRYAHAGLFDADSKVNFIDLEPFS